jgi:hypothetical protein
MEQLEALGHSAGFSLRGELPGGCVGGRAGEWLAASGSQKVRRTHRAVVAHQVPLSLLTDKDAVHVHDRH